MYVATYSLKLLPQRAIFGQLYANGKRMLPKEEVTKNVVEFSSKIEIQ